MKGLWQDLLQVRRIWSGHFANVCTVKKEGAKSDVMAAVKGEKESAFYSVKTGPHLVHINVGKMKDEILSRCTG